MNASILRQFWSVIEETQASTLLRLNDTELARQLLIQLEHKPGLSLEDLSSISTYLYSRLPLIRDLAQSRLA